MRVPFSFAAIDFETTGSVEGYPVEPWQIGVVRADGPDRIRTWDRLLKIGPRPFHPRAPGRHAAVRGELEQSPFLRECLESFRAHCAGVPLVAHNASTERACLRDQVPMEQVGPWIDTLKLSRAAWPGLASHRLEDLLERFGLMTELRRRCPGREPHDALFDAWGSALLLAYLLEQPGWEAVTLEVLVNPDVGDYYRRS